MREKEVFLGARKLIVREKYNFWSARKVMARKLKARENKRN